MGESAGVKTMPGIDLKQMHVLILGRVDGAEELTHWIDEHAWVERVDTFEQALEALRCEPVDVIVSRAADLIPLHGVGPTGQAAAQLDSACPGVCIVDSTGRLEWANPRMLSFAEELRKRVCRCGMDTFKWAQAAVEAGTERLHGRRFRITVGQDEQFDVTATPIIDLHKQITRVAAVVWGVADGRRLQEQIDAIDRAGRELLSLEIKQFARLDTPRRLELLDERIHRCIRELLHFENFEIFVLDRKRGNLAQVLVSGLPGEGSGAEPSISIEGSGICGYVAATGCSYICPDAASDPRYLPGIDDARSSLTVPLLLHDEVVGVANFESTRSAAFNEDDRQFAEIFGRYIALALQILDLLVAEGRMVTGRVGTNVMTQITGPLNDILTEVENLVEDYIGHDDLRHRLRMISDNAVRIRETVKDITARKRGVIADRLAPRLSVDPVLDGKRVLVVDDEEIIRETVRDVLSGCGCRVTAVEDGAEAVNLLGGECFDLVLSDIKLPGKNGYEVFAAAKKADAAVPVILMTGFGYDPNHAIVRAHRDGLSAVLFKPFKVDQLLGELRAAFKSLTKA